MKKAYLGIDIGSISTKGVIIDEEKNILAGIYLWTEGNPMGAAKKVIAALGEKIDQNEYQVVAAGTTGSADRKSTRLNSSHNVISRMPSSA